MKKVVILGGGFAGAKIAKSLEKYFEVTLVDSKDYYEFTPGVLRSIVKPYHLSKIQVLHSHYLKKAKVLVECVKEINSNYVKTEKNRLVFDYLIICLGSSYNTPFKEKEVVVTTRGAHLRNYSKQLQKAEKIVIIGGGIVGVELAAEIKEFYKDKKITIIHKNDKLMERNHLKTISHSKKFLKNKNVDIIYNEKASVYDKKTITTNKGTKIKADLFFICTGITPNSDSLKKNLGSSLNDNNQIKVNDYLQMENYNNIFAAGDITNINEEKLAQNAEKQARIVIKNIKNINSQKPLVKYSSKPRIMVISLGRWNGVLQYKSLIISGIIPGILKTLIEWKTMIKYRF
ncbi:MAG TPA: FAD-dependent oxidoreductase [Candidatus Nanoarchaeia archaeon]|nr:FAD-dependent oxidoreductase [Candidatus Nanoarchaeia archaeon]